MKIIYCIPLLYLSVLASDNNEYSLLIKQDIQYPKNTSKPANYTVTVPVQQIGRVDEIKQMINEHHSLNAMCMDLAPVFVTLLRSKTIMAHGETTIEHLKTLKEFAPQVTESLPELQKRRNDFTEFLKTHKN